MHEIIDGGIVMEKLSPYFPLSFNVLPGDVKSLILTLIIYLVACAIMGVLNAVLGWIPLVGWLLRLIFSLVGLYCVAGMVLAVMKFFKTE